MNPITVKLVHPIENGSETFESFEIREPTGRDFETFPVSPEPKVGAFLDLAARLAEVPPPVMRKLKGPDVFAVVNAVGEFVKGGPPTGET